MRAATGRKLQALLGALVALLLTGLARSEWPRRALRARALILELRLDEADAILGSAVEDDALVAVERARLALYRADCDLAVTLLGRPDVAALDETAPLWAVALGCARGTAATLSERDLGNGVVVRFQDDADRPLFPLVVDAATRARDALARDLGVRLPSPVHVDLVRDQLTLAALTGLPERAAQTTGTVAVAKWGRVTMVSPRAAPHGFAWLDTLAHEMAHLAVSQATRDRAPLWLQEGVAKREETRWREPSRFDAVPSSDALAAAGIARGLGLPLAGLGPSIALLPSPEQATVAFAEVASFLDYWVARAGDDALPRLLGALRAAPAAALPDAAIAAVSGKDLGTWERQWRSWLAASGHDARGGPSLLVPPDNAREIARRERLAELLLARGHARAARLEASLAQALGPTDATIRCLHADALRAVGEEIAAGELVAEPAAIALPTGRWWSLHDVYQLSNALPHARWHALALDPLAPEVACEERELGELPIDAVRRALCEAARREPWEP